VSAVVTFRGSSDPIETVGETGGMSKRGVAAEGGPGVECRLIAPPMTESCYLNLKV
jgi:hypothetical protein